MRSERLRFCLPAPLVLVALLAGCASSAGDASEPATTSPPATVAPTTTPTAAPTTAATTLAATTYPITINAANGAVTLPDRPQAIISLSPTATEMLFAIGAGAQVKAVDDQSNYPPEAPKTDLSGYQPNVEAIAAKQPDLVVVADDSSKLTASLGKLKIPVLSLPAAASLADAYTQLEQLGAATGHVGDAAEVVSTMKTEIDAVVQSLAASPAPLTYYHELDNTYYSATSKTFIGQIYSLLGLKNIADSADKAGTGYPQLSQEYIIQSDPDLIFLADTKCCQQSAATVGARPGWKQINAVKAGNVVPLDDDLASRWGPRIVDYLKAVAAAVAKVQPAPGQLNDEEATVAIAPPVDQIGVVPAPLVGTRLHWRVVAVAFGALAGAFVLGVSVGPARLPVTGVVKELLDRLPFVSVSSGLSEVQRTILWQVRMPRVVLGGMVGAMLASCGAAYQGVFRNPLADPYLLGVAAGAGLGATLAIVYGPSGSILLPAAAMLGGSVAVLITYALGATVARERSAASIVLAGVAVAAFFTAAQTYLQQQHSETLREVYSWILGRLTQASWSDVRLLLPYALLSAAALLAHRRLLDVLQVGEEEADALGINAARVRIAVVVAATLGTAAAVAVTGLIGFVGIIVAHSVRLVTRGTYRIVLPLSMVGGAAFLIVADVIARSVQAPAELPIGVVTAFFGAPFFLLVLRRSGIRR